jgi:putative phosphoesterase
MADIAVLSDTHRESGTGLAGRAADAVADADAVIHAGDFTTAAVLDDVRDRAARLHAVHGNSDTDAVCERLPAARTVPVGGVTVALTHRRRGGATGLRLFGEERGAALVVSGHSHRPSVTGRDPVLLDPGSHTSPRGGPPTHAELSVTDAGLEGHVRTRDGEIVESIAVSVP